MLINERLKELREAKNLSQGDIEQRTGLLRCYTSRVEHGHTVPTVETLEKYARALEVPLYKLFHDGTEAAKPPHLGTSSRAKELVRGSNPKDSAELRKFVKVLARMDDKQRKLLHVASQMARRDGD